MSMFQFPEGGWWEVTKNNHLCLQGTSPCLAFPPRGSLCLALGRGILLYDTDRKLSDFPKGKKKLRLGLQVPLRALEL